MAKTNVAYNLDIFEENETAIAEVLPQEEKVKNKKGKRVVNLPKSEIHRIRRRRHNPLKLTLGFMGGVAATLIIATIVVGQVKITELNAQIIDARQNLAETESIYTQTEMSLQSKLTTSDIEQYAENQLGMTKASNTQKEFVTLSGGDKAEVTFQRSENLFTQFIDSIKNLWS